MVEFLDNILAKDPTFEIGDRSFSSQGKAILTGVDTKQVVNSILFGNSALRRIHPFVRYLKDLKLDQYGGGLHKSECSYLNLDFELWTNSFFIFRRVGRLLRIS